MICRSFSARACNASISCTSVCARSCGGGSPAAWKRVAQLLDDVGQDCIGPLRIASVASWFTGLATASTNAIMRIAATSSFPADGARAAEITGDQGVADARGVIPETPRCRDRPRPLAEHRRNRLRGVFRRDGCHAGKAFIQLEQCDAMIQIGYAVDCRGRVEERPSRSHSMRARLLRRHGRFEPSLKIAIRFKSERYRRRVLRQGPHRNK